MGGNKSSGQHHKPERKSTSGEPVNRSQGNQAKSDVVKEAKRIINEAKKK